MLISKRWGRVEVLRVGPKNVRVKLLEGGAKGSELLSPAHELRREEDTPLRVSRAEL